MRRPPVSELPPRLSFDMRHVRAFTAIAKECHFGRAARTLNMSEPALSRLIKALEQAIGTPLLVRTTRSVTVNEAGQAFLAECQLAYGHLTRARSAAAAAAEGRSGTLRVGYMDFAMNGALPAILRGFIEWMPTVQIELMYAPSSGQRRALFDGRLDVGFLVGEMIARNAQNLPVWNEHHVLILPERHHLATKKAVELRELSAEPFVLGDSEQFGGYRPLVFELCADAGFFPKIVQEASNSTGIFGMVAAGTGVSIYGACALNSPRNGTVIRPISNVEGGFVISASWLSDNQSTVLRSFVRFLSDMIPFNN